MFVRPDTQFETFIFMTTAIFLEAAPFVVMGSLLAALFEVFVSPERVFKLVPRSKFLQSLTGIGAGLVLPTCECGVVPIVRRLMAKGIPPRMAFAYMLSAPVINPLVLLSTYVAFRGDVWMVLGRAALAFAVAMIAGTAAARVYSSGKQMVTLSPGAFLPMAHPPGQEAHCPCCDHDSHAEHKSRFVRVCTLTAHEFVEMSKYLIIGCLVAGAFKVYVWGMWGGFLTVLAGNLYLSTAVMMLMAILLCVCSEADAFVAASFWVFGSIPQLAFMAIGPAVDLKLIYAFLAVFGLRTALVLTAVPTLVVYFLCILMGWVIG